MLSCFILDEESEKVKKKGHTDEAQTREAQVVDFDNESLVWSDYLATNFHPKSVQIVEQYYHKNEYQPFDVYMCGKEVLQTYEAFCDWEDRIHHFAEECDNLQGFHVLMDTHDGFGGLSDMILKYLEEEFPRKGILTFGFTPADAPDSTPLARSTRIINSALSYDSASSCSSLFIPTSTRRGLWSGLGQAVEFDGLVYNNRAYQTSSILASALDTLSLQYRQDGDQSDIRELTHGLNIQGRKIASLSTSLPLRLHENGNLTDFFSQYTQCKPGLPWQSLTPHVGNDKVPLMQAVVLRGIAESKVKSDIDPRKLPHHFLGVKTRHELLQNFLAEKYPGSGFMVNCMDTAMKTAAPFPQIFNETVNKNGLMRSGSDLEKTCVDSVPVITSVQGTPEIQTLVDKLYTTAVKMNIKKHHRYIAGGLEEDDYSEVLENLKTLAKTYKMNSEALE